MSGLTLWLMIGAAAGFVLIVADLLVSPVVRGWRTDRPMVEWLPDADPRTLGVRVIDNLLALALVAAIVLAFRFAGFV
jgi:hypothetical protein